MVARASQFQSNCMQLAAQLKATRDRWQTTCATNVSLQRELVALRAQVSERQVLLNIQSAMLASRCGPPRYTCRSHARIWGHSMMLRHVQEVWLSTEYIVEQQISSRLSSIHNPPFGAAVPMPVYT